MTSRLTALVLSATVVACGGERDEHPAPDACAFATAGAPWLAFASRRPGNYDVFVARSDGTCVTPLTTDPATDLYPSWSPDQVVAFASERNARLGVWLHDLATGQETALDVGDLYATSPAFSPDGTLVAFEGRVPSDATTDVYVVAATGGTPTRLTDDAADDAGPAWSPDGQTVYFVSRRTGTYDVHSVPAAGGAATRITTGSRILGKPAVTPDGLALVFARTVSGSSAAEVVRYEFASGATTVVSSQDDSEPAIAPGGTRVAVRSFRDGEADLYVVDLAAGANAVRLTADVASDGAPAFAPSP